jgi:RNA polymerase sigma-70 factor (ECF subfamily)
MEGSESTRWTFIRAAAEGDPEARREFAATYDPIIRAYLGARWRRSPLVSEIDDAAQEVFVVCFEEAGALSRVEPGRPGGFRAFLFGVVRNVARRVEERRAKAARQPDSALDLGEIEARDEPLSGVFDRAWAAAIVRLAVRRYSERNRGAGKDAERRVELLRLRFGQDLPIRDIAVRWNVDAARLHHEYARARAEFRTVLGEVLAGEDRGGDPEAECLRLAEFLTE